MAFLRFYFYTINEDVEGSVRDLKSTMSRIYMEYDKIVRRGTPEIAQSDQNMPPNGSTSSSARGPLLGKRRIELAFAEFDSQRLDSHSQRSELDKYLEDPRVIVTTNENFDILGWWKNHADAYPILSLMAWDFLAIPVSTVSSESAFSNAGRILGKERTSLGPETLEALICAKDWFMVLVPRMKVNLWKDDESLIPRMMMTPSMAIMRTTEQRSAENHVLDVNKSVMCLVLH